MLDNEEFKLVTRRKKRGSSFRENCRTTARSCGHLANHAEQESDEQCDIELECDRLLRKLHDAEIEVKKCPFAERVLEGLAESLNVLDARVIDEIICYGLGRFSERRASRYQLALLLHVKRQYESPVSGRVRSYVYDPAFSATEIALLERSEFRVIGNNEEGKRVVGGKATLVYMPHCPIHLINNFLYANWGERLSRCVLVTNSFSSLTENSVRSVNVGRGGGDGGAYVDYVSRLRPYVTEIKLKNDFDCEEAFNDLGIHVFPKRDLERAPAVEWTTREEPSYRDASVEFVTAEETARSK